MDFGEFDFPTKTFYYFKCYLYLGVHSQCFPRGDANWDFECPEDCLLPLKGTITNDFDGKPYMCHSGGEPCLLVIKSSNATGTTIGRVNGVFTIIRNYFNDMSMNYTSMEGE